MVRVFSPSIAAWSSIRLLVVCAEAPEIDFCFLLYSKTAAQPPIPGLPEQAPSVCIVTVFIGDEFVGSVFCIGFNKMELIRHNFENVVTVELGGDVLDKLVDIIGPVFIQEIEDV